MSFHGALRSQPPTDDPDFIRLKTLIIKRTGNAYFSDKDGALWERIARRLQAVGVDTCAHYMELLEGHASLECAAEWVALEAEITIGETFFFRYQEQFTALRDTILPEIIERNSATRHLRIWSAGCSTGAEPYSVAIVLRELLGADFDQWSIRIIGTDLNEAFLETARAGWFGAWALRTLSPRERESYFLPSATDGRFLLKPEHRSNVMFQRHNLIDLLDVASTPLQLDGFDLILCRNVLIYFEADVASRIMSALSSRLNNGCWLLVGAAEPIPAAEGLARVPLNGAVAYQRGSLPRRARATEDRQNLQRAGEIRSAAAPAARRNKAVSPGKKEHAPGLARRHESDGPTAPKIDGEGARPCSQAETIRLLCGRGALESARVICLEWLAKEPMNGVGQYYDGLIAVARNDDQHAERALRRAIYIDKNFIMAHYHLGLLLMRKGRHVAGRRHILNAMMLAKTLPSDSLVPEGGDLSAQWLLSTAAHYLDVTGRGPQVAFK